jgi:hypothetical protein
MGSTPWARAGAVVKMSHRVVINKTLKSLKTLRVFQSRFQTEFGNETKKVPFKVFND